MILEKYLEQHIDWGVEFELTPIDDEAEPDETQATSLLYNILDEEGLVPSEGEVKYEGRQYRYCLRLDVESDDWICPEV